MRSPRWASRSRRGPRARAVRPGVHDGPPAGRISVSARSELEYGDRRASRGGHGPGPGRGAAGAVGAGLPGAAGDPLAGRRSRASRRGDRRGGGRQRPDGLRAPQGAAGGGAGDDAGGPDVPALPRAPRGPRRTPAPAARRGGPVDARRRPARAGPGERPDRAGGARLGRAPLPAGAGVHRVHRSRRLHPVARRARLAGGRATSPRPWSGAPRSAVGTSSSSPPS